MRTRNCSLHLRLTKKEIEDLRKKAERAGVSIQTYFIWMLYNHPIKEAPPIEYQEVLRDLRQIGNNLNQIAASVQATGSVESEKYWETVSELQKTIGKLMESAYA